MLCPVSVPKGEHCVVREFFGLVDLVVQAPVGSVHIHVDRRVDHRVVEGCVEHLLLSVSAFDVHYGKLFLPSVSGISGNLVKWLSGSLCFQVLQGAGRSG